jgi:hypothetical protein
MKIDISDVNPEDIKAVVIDIDGTLLNSDEEIPEENIKIIRELQRLGKKIIFASGRGLKSAKSVIERFLDSDYTVIAYNGGMIEKGGKIIYHRTLESEKAVEFYKKMKEYENTFVQAYINDDLYVPSLESRAYSYSKHAGIPFIHAPEMIELITKNRPTKLLVIDKVEKLDFYIEELQPQFPELSLVKSFGEYMEVLPKDVNKGDALKELVKEEKMSMKNVISFGDNDNDLSMLKMSGIGVAMGNANDELKRVADYVAPTHDSAGIAKTLKKLFGL